MIYTPAFISLYLANLSLVASFASFFLLPLFITAHGGNQRDIGIVMGIFALASALCRPWVSSMIDRFGRKRSYTVGSVLMLLLPLTYLLIEGPLANNYFLLLLIRIIHGVGLAICFTAAFTLIADLLPTNRLNEGIGIFGTSGLLGLALGPAIAEPILDHFGFTAFFLTAFSMALIGFMAHLPLREISRDGQSVQATSSTFFRLLMQPKLRFVALVSVLFGFGLAATGNFIAPLVESRHLPHIAYYYLAYSLAAVSIRFYMGRFADRVGERRVLPWGLGFSALGLLLIPLISNNVLLICSGLVFGCGHGLLFPTINALAIRNEPYSVRGKITGIFTGGIDTGAFIGAVLLGIVGERYGYPSLFICSGCVVAGGYPLFRRFIRNHSANSAQIGQ